MRRLPRTDIDCSANIGGFGARRLPERGRRAWEIDTGHDLKVTEPEKLAEMLLRRAA